MSHRKKPIVARILTVVLSGTVAHQAPAVQLAQTIQPLDLPKKTGAEYYSSRPDKKVLMPVNIWGEVKIPGVHLIPDGSTLIGALSAAGGPGALADYDEATIQRGDKKIFIDPIKDGHKFILQSDDIVFVDTALKRDLPLIFSAVSTIVSVATLYFVTRKK